MMGMEACYTVAQVNFRHNCKLSLVRISLYKSNFSLDLQKPHESCESCFLPHLETFGLVISVLLLTSDSFMTWLLKVIIYLEVVRMTIASEEAVNV